MNKKTEQLYVDRINELADDKALLGLALDKVIPMTQEWWSIKGKMTAKTKKFNEVMNEYRAAKESKRKL